MLSALLLALAIAPVRDTVPVDSIAVAAASDTIPRRRPKAIQYSDAYSTRLTIHRIGSYTMLPMFVAAGALGGDADSPDARRRHRNVALGSIAVSTAGTAMMWFWKD